MVYDESVMISSLTYNVFFTLTFNVKFALNTGAYNVVEKVIYFSNSTQILKLK